MSEDMSARLALNYLAAGQMQSHVTLNEALTRLDALVQCRVISRSQASQPAEPEDGDLFILPAGATGTAWSELTTGALVRFEAGYWATVAVPQGLLAMVADEARYVVWQDGAWSPFEANLQDLQNLSLLGIGTTADAANPLSAKLNNVLFTALEAASGGDGDVRFKINKETAVDTASLLFQDGYSGRAELGLIGDDQYRLKVSADGSTWHEVFSVDPATGRPTFAKGAMRDVVTNFTASGTYDVPAWARWLDIICIAGGGGGGAGASGIAGTARYGGGGGGSGGICAMRISTSALASSLAVEMSAAGAGSASGAGAQGGYSRIRSGSRIFIWATGGNGGGAGSANGPAGGGGLGDFTTNPGGASSVSAAGAVGQGYVRPDGAAGGGGGGGLSVANVAFAGGTGGTGAPLRTAATAGTAGTGAAGGNGADTPDLNLYWAGGGGGGGGANALGAGYNGGNGGNYGGGGGGGGAGLTAGGAGGNGGAGIIIIAARG